MREALPALLTPCFSLICVFSSGTPQVRWTLP
jgi:hypothetical protein